MTRPLIVDHTFRPNTKKTAIPGSRRGTRGGSTVRPGKCIWNGTCGRTEKAHITVEAFRQRRLP